MSKKNNTANTFGGRFIEATTLSERTVSESARLGKLPSILSSSEIARMVADGESDSSLAEIIQNLDFACKRGELKAELSGPRNKFETICYVHRDNARRYFASLGLDPDVGSPLWCWLRDKASDQVGKLKPEQQDKADFQQACVEVWKISPTITITGNAGMVNHSDVRSYLKKYKAVTLEKWAREVAPNGVKGKRGAPRKNIPPAKK